MIIKGVGIGRGVAVGPVIRMAQPLPEPSDAPRAEGIAVESEIARVEKSLALVNADLNRRAEEAANGDEGAKQAAPILQAVAMFASDPSLAESIKGLVQQGKTAERAVLEASPRWKTCSAPSVDIRPSVPPICMMSASA